MRRGIPSALHLRKPVERAPAPVGHKDAPHGDAVCGPPLLPPATPVAPSRDRPAARFRAF